MLYSACFAALLCRSLHGYLLHQGPLKREAANRVKKNTMCVTILLGYSNSDYLETGVMMKSENKKQYRFRE